MIVQLGNMSKESSVKISTGKGESTAGWAPGRVPAAVSPRRNPPPSLTPSIPPLRWLEAAAVFLQRLVLSHSRNPVPRGLPAAPGEESSQLNPQTPAAERRALNNRRGVFLLPRWRWERQLFGCVDTIKYHCGPTVKTH